jgi:hypothetical protein
MSVTKVFSCDICGDPADEDGVSIPFGLDMGGGNKKYCKKKAVTGMIETSESNPKVVNICNDCIKTIADRE